jgi:hypothetical protein
VRLLLKAMPAHASPLFFISMSGIVGYLSIGISPNKSREFRRSSQLLKRRRATTNGYHLSGLD